MSTQNFARALQGSPQKIERKLISGIVVRNDDPLEMQRVRVRVHDLHRDIVDEDIPWALKRDNVGYGQSNGGTGETNVPPVGSKVYLTFQTDDLYFPMWHGAPATTDVGSVAEFQPYPEVYGAVDWAGNRYAFQCTEGNVNITLTHVSGTQFHINHEGDIIIHGARDWLAHIARDIIFRAGRSIVFDAGGNITLRANEDINLNAGAAVDIRAATDVRIDAGTDLNLRARIDAIMDAGLNASVRAGIEAVLSGGVNVAVTGGMTASVDGGVSAELVGGVNATVDGGVAATLNGGIDAGVNGGVLATLTGGIDSYISGLLINLASIEVLVNDVAAPAGPPLVPTPPGMPATPGTPNGPNAPAVPIEPEPVEPRERPVITFVPDNIDY